MEKRETLASIILESGKEVKLVFNWESAMYEASIGDAGCIRATLAGVCRWIKEQEEVNK